MVEGSHRLLFVAMLALLGLPALAQTPATISNGADADIIQPGGLYGSSSVSGGVLTLKGSGPDLQRSSKGFHAYWWSILGDGSITARVLSLTNTNPYAKAGLVLDESPYYNFVYAIPSGKVAGYNAFLDSTSVYVSYSFPIWLKAVQQSGIFTVSACRDGVNWQVITSAEGYSPQHVGLAVTSHDVTQLATAVFDNVSVTGNVSSIPDFTVTTTPIVQSVAPDSEALFKATVAPRNGFFGQVEVDTNSFDAFVPFAGVDSRFGPTPAPGEIDIVISPQFGTPPGTYPVNLFLSSLPPSPYVGHGSNVNITVTGNLLPAPTGASETDIGNPPEPGSSSFLNGVLSLHGSGNLSITPDQFHYYYWLMNGNGSVTARLTSLSGTTSNLKAGIMMRQFLTGTADYVMASAPTLHGGQVGSQLQYRDQTNPGHVFIAPYTYHDLPVWIRLMRVGNVFEVRWSTDGQTWYLYDGSVMPYSQADNHTNLVDPIYVGFATNTDAVFDNIQVTGNFENGPPFIMSPMKDLTVKRGTNANFTVSVSPVIGFSDAIKFTAVAYLAGVGSMITPTVSPASLTSAGTVTVTIPTSNLKGSLYYVTLMATYLGGVLTEQANLTIQ